MTTPKKAPASQPAFAVSIPEAAAMVGLGTTAFYEQFLEPGRVQSVWVGKRRLIVVEELRRAFDQYVIDSRAAHGDG